MDPKKTWTVAETKDGGWARLTPKFYDEESFPKQGDELVFAEPEGKTDAPECAE